MSDKTTEIPKLMSCSACGQDIATFAVTCPKCGAPNTWVHPEITRFHQLFRSARTPPFNVTTDRFLLHGNSTVTPAAWAAATSGGVGIKLAGYGIKAVVVGVLTFLLVVMLDELLPSLRQYLRPWTEKLLGLSGFVAIGGVVLLLLSWFKMPKATDSLVAFTVDFSKTPPEWRSGDDAFWSEVYQYFFARVEHKTDSDNSQNVNIANDPVLTNVDQRGNDIYADLQVRRESLAEGRTISLNIPLGHTIELNLTPDMADGRMLCLKGQAFEGAGDLLLRVCIAMSIAAEPSAEPSV